MKNKEVGTYTVYAYGYTNWGEKVLLKKNFGLYNSLFDNEEEQ